MPRWTGTVIRCGLCFFLGGCGGDSGSANWEDLFVELGTTTLTDSGLVELNRSIERAGSGPLSGHVLNSGATSVWTARQGEELARSLLGLPRAITATPYWTSFLRLSGAQSRGSAFAAVNLLYPIYIFGGDGTLIDSISSPPASWRQARRPARGEFSADQPERIADYLRSFTVITGLAAIADSVLIVGHGEYRADDGERGRWKWDGRVDRTATHRAHGLADITTVVDVYVEGRRVIADHPAPGEIFGNSTETVFFLRRDSTGAGWQIREYGMRGRRGASEISLGP